MKIFDKSILSYLANKISIINSEKNNYAITDVSSAKKYLLGLISLNTFPNISNKIFRNINWNYINFIKYTFIADTEIQELITKIEQSYFEENSKAVLFLNATASPRQFNTNTDNYFNHNAKYCNITYLSNTISKYARSNKNNIYKVYKH